MFFISKRYKSLYSYYLIKFVTYLEQREKSLVCLVVMVWYKFICFANYGTVLQGVVSVSFLTSQNLFMLPSVISDTIQRADMDK